MWREAAFYALAHEGFLTHPRGMARGPERLAAPYHDIGLGSQAIHLQAIRSRAQGEVLAVVARDFSVERHRQIREYEWFVHENSHPAVVVRPLKALKFVVTSCS